MSNSNLKLFIAHEANVPVEVLLALENCDATEGVFEVDEKVDVVEKFKFV